MAGASPKVFLKARENAVSESYPIDLRGFLGIDPDVPAGYECLHTTVRIKGNGSKEDFAAVHQAVMSTSPNFYNVSRAVALQSTFVVG